MNTSNRRRVIKPQKRVEEVTEVYWSCTNLDHRHSTEKSALDCINRVDAMKNLYRPAFKEVRMLVIAARAIEGETTGDISQDFDITPERCAQLTQIVGRMVERKLPKLMPGREIPDGSHFLRKMRENRNWWLKAIELLAKDMGIYDDYIKHRR